MYRRDESSRGDALYTNVNDQCDKLAEVVNRTRTVTGISLVRPRRSIVYHTERPFSSAKLTIRCDYRRAVAKFFKFLVWESSGGKYPRF